MLKLERNSTLIVLKETLTGVAFGLWAYILPVHLSAIGATPRQVWKPALRIMKVDP